MSQVNFYSSEYRSDSTSDLPPFGQSMPAFADPDDEFANEPPLLVELGINWLHIRTKTLAVLNPMRRDLDQDTLDDSDLAGPFIFALGLGALLLLRGKWTFDYIYGFTTVGTLALYFLVNVMSHDNKAEIVSLVPLAYSKVSFYKTLSILGYCLLPMGILAALTLVLPPSGILGASIATLCVIWCTYSATYLFTTPFMLDQKILVAYPLALFYACFALLTIF